MVGWCLKGSKNFKYSLLFSSEEDKMNDFITSHQKGYESQNFGQDSYKVLYSLTLKNVILVTGSFMYQLETGAQIKYYFWVCLWGFFQMKLAFELVDPVEQIAVLYVNDYYPWKPKQNKRQSHEDFSFLSTFLC